MDPSLILIIVLTFAFAATHIEERLFGARSTLFASLEYLLIGILVGPYALGFLGHAELRGLEPLLSVVTGFAGFLVGLGLSFRRASLLPRGTFGFAAVTGVVGAGIVFSLAYLAFRETPIDAFRAIGRDAALVGAATLGLGAVITAVAPLRSGILSTSADGPLSRLLPAVAQTIAVFAIIGFGLTLAAFRAGSTDDDLRLLVWDGIAIASGVGFGLIFHVFVGEERDEKKLFVATIGIVALASGTASALNFSPLFINLVAGATIANVSRATGALVEAGLRLRHPVFVLLLLLAGASWDPMPLAFWAVPCAYVVVRILALRVGARLALATVRTEVDPSTPRVGNALLSQGALVAAVAVNFDMVLADTVIGDVVMTTLLVSAVVNELWSGLALRRVLQGAGESRRSSAQPPPADVEAPPPAAAPPADEVAH